MELDLELYSYQAPERAAISWGLWVVALVFIIIFAVAGYYLVRWYTSPRARLKRACVRLIKKINIAEDPRFYLDEVSAAAKRFIQIEKSQDAVWHMTDHEIVNALLVDSIGVDVVFRSHLETLERLKFSPGSIDKNQILAILKSIAVI
jgi:hypothetical protein